MTQVVEIYKAYNGTGYFCLLFIAALIYLWFSEQNRSLRVLIVIVPTVIQILFFIPYFYMAYDMLDEGTYYRILWLLPMTLVIAYSAVRVISSHFRIGVAVVCLIIALSGTYAYTGMTFSKAENAYHIPEDVVRLCDMVRPKEGEEKIFVAFPPILVHFVRQYTTDILLPFGRDSMVASWKRAENPFFDLYMSHNKPADMLARYATEYQCEYIILDAKDDIVGDVTDYGLEEYGRVNDYIIYKNLSSSVWADPTETGYMNALFRDEENDDTD